MYKPKILERPTDKESYTGYSKNIVKFENKCIKCSEIFIGFCYENDRFEFKRFCPKCKHNFNQRPPNEEGI